MNCIEQENYNETKRREKNMIGKYLVVTADRYNSSISLFLQDGRYGDGYWTKFIINAKVFHDKTAAIIKAKNLQFNNPRVVLVKKNMKLEEVYRNG